MQCLVGNARRFAGHWKYGGLTQVCRFIKGRTQQLRGDAYFRGKDSVDRHCPCCGWEGRLFKPYVSGGYTTLDALCPQCGSHGRHRSHILYYRDHLQLFEKSGRLLYFAPEQGILPHLKEASGLDVETTDYEEIEDVDHKYDIMDIPVNDNSFNLIVCHRVVEHVPDDRKAMHELLRILKPGGMAILSVPISANLERTVEFGEPNPLCDKHFYEYGRDFRTRIPEGFDVRVITLRELFGDEMSSRLALLKDWVFECSKPG